MTIDWFVLLAPLLLLPIVALFVFAGCAEIVDFPEFGFVPDFRFNWRNLDPNEVTKLRVIWSFTVASSGRILSSITEDLEVGSGTDSHTVPSTLVANRTGTRPEVNQVLCKCEIKGPSDTDFRAAPGAQEKKCDFPGKANPLVWEFFKKVMPSGQFDLEPVNCDH